MLKFTKYVDESNSGIVPRKENINDKKYFLCVVK